MLCGRTPSTAPDAGRAHSAGRGDSGSCSGFPPRAAAAPPPPDPLCVPLAQVSGLTHPGGSLRTCAATVGDSCPGHVVDVPRMCGQLRAGPICHGRPHLPWGSSVVRPCALPPGGQLSRADRMGAQTRMTGGDGGGRPPALRPAGWASQRHSRRLAWPLHQQPGNSCPFPAVRADHPGQEAPDA